MDFLAAIGPALMTALLVVSLLPESEHISHEAYVAQVREQVVDIAKKMLAGELNFLEGARRLVD